MIHHSAINKIIAEHLTLNLQSCEPVVILLRAQTINIYFCKTYMVLMIIHRKCVNKPRQNNSKATHDKKLKISVKLQKTKIYLLM